MMKIPWTKQPQFHVGIDWSNPLTEGLVCAINAASLHEVVTNKGLTLVGSKTSPNESGISIVSNGSSTYAYIDFKEKTYVEGTILAVTRPFSLDTNRGVVQFASTNYLLPIFSLRSGNADATKMRFFIRDDAGVGFGIGIGDGSLNAFSLNKTSVLVYTFANSPGYTFAYVDGIKDPNYDAVAGGNFTLNRVTIGALSFYGGTADFYNGGTSLVLVFAVQKTDKEIFSLSQNPWQIFAPIERHIPLVASQPQLLVPISDVSAGSWTPSSGSDLYAMLDEASYSDADYIVTSTPSTCEMRVTTATDPAVSTGHILRYRLLAGTGSITAILKQGSTTIASFGPHTLTGSAQDFAQTLSAGQADSITDYSDLRVVFTAS